MLDCMALTIPSGPSVVAVDESSLESGGASGVGSGVFSGVSAGVWIAAGDGVDSSDSLVAARGGSGVTDAAGGSGVVSALVLLPGGLTKSCWKRSVSVTGTSP